MPTLPRLVITGASGFLARHVMRALKSQYRFVALDRHSRQESQVPPGGDVEWHQVDLDHPPQVERVFQRIAAGGGAQALIHLAAHYDFTGEEHPEYWSTNVEALRYVLDGSRALHLELFVFASSLAACAFPPPGHVLTEESPADGEHIYARTKRIGEEMLAEYRDAFPSVIVRFAALFSDWCEYLPLYHLLGTWLSGRWNANILAGRGRSALPFLHVRDAALCLAAVLDRRAELEPQEVLIAADGRVTSHRELHVAATRELYGKAPVPLFMPKALCLPGLWMLDTVARQFGERPFERPWMVRYIDRRLAVDPSRTHRRLGWVPRPRLAILRRMPFLIENFRTDPIEWHRRNQEIVLRQSPGPSLRVYQLILDHREAIVARAVELLAQPEVGDKLSHYRMLGEEELQWSLRQALRNLLHAVRTRRKGLFMAYCRDLAERRAALGFRVFEVAYFFHALRQACHEVVDGTPEGEELSDEVRSLVNQTVRFGIDQVQMIYEATRGRTVVPDSPAGSTGGRGAEAEELTVPSAPAGARESP